MIISAIFSSVSLFFMVSSDEFSSFVNVVMSVIGGFSFSCLV